jgi:hypothetical protein
MKKIRRAVDALSRNRLSPRYINIATTRYKFAGAAAQPSPKKQNKRNRRETNADTGRSTKRR